jgi:virulence-associated protein VagC
MESQMQSQKQRSSPTQQAIRIPKDLAMDSMIPRVTVRTKLRMFPIQMVNPSVTSNVSVCLVESPMPVESESRRNASTNHMNIEYPPNSIH